MTLSEIKERYEETKAWPLKISDKDVFDPMGLCRRMVSKIPFPQNRKILGMKIAIIGEKSGALTFAILEKLDKIYSKFVSNKETRLRLMLNKITVITLGYELEGITNWVIYGDDEFNSEHIYYYNSIEDIPEDMKFDIVIGNPPYRLNVHLTFLEKAYKISKKYIILVHPSTWLISEKSNKRHQRIKNLIRNNVVSFELFNGNPIFDAFFFVPCVITFIDKSKNNPSFALDDNTKDKHYIYNDIDKVNVYGNEPVYWSLKDKISQYAEIDNLQNHSRVDGSYYVNVAKLRGNIDRNGEKRVLSDFYTFVPNNLVTSKHKIVKREYFGFETELESKNFLNYIRTKFARFCLSIYKISGYLNRGELSIVPYMDYNRNWTDKELYKYFNLSQEEIDFIEENIPDY